MRDEPPRTIDRTTRPARAARLLVLLLALAPPARAEGLFGSFQVQAQRVEDLVYVTQADGSLVPRRVARNQYLQVYDVNHRDHPRDDLLIHTALRFTGISFSNTSNTLRTPEGSIRVVHPWANLFASRIATTSKLAIGSSGAVTPDTGAVLSVTTKQIEDQIVAHVAPPRWPANPLRVSYMSYWKFTSTWRSGDRW